MKISESYIKGRVTEEEAIAMGYTGRFSPTKPTPAAVFGRPVIIIGLISYRDDGSQNVVCKSLGGLAGWRAGGADGDWEDVDDYLIKKFGGGARFNAIELRRVNFMPKTCVFREEN